MNNEDIKKQLEEQQKALVQIYKSVEKTRKYILWSTMSSILFFILPLIIFAFMMPKIMSTFNTAFGVVGVEESLSPKGFKKSLDSLQELGLSL